MYGYSESGIMVVTFHNITPITPLTLPNPTISLLPSTIIFIIHASVVWN